MHITLIAAMDRNRVIGGNDGGIPWHLPRDTERFREFTNGKFLLLGRKTFEEMDGWFTNQIPIVLTRQVAYEASPGVSAQNVEEAISLAAERGAEELVVCGGAFVYSEALPYTDELYLTLIDAEIDGAARFPDYDSEAEWETVSRESFSPDPENVFSMEFVQLRRLHPSSLRPPRLHLI